MKKDFSKSLQKKNNKSFIINKEIVENYIIAPSTTKNASLENNSNRRNNKSKVRLSFNITSETKKIQRKIQIIRIGLINLFQKIIIKLTYIINALNK